MIYSGSWDRQVRFWDVRANRLSASIGGKTSISGDGVDISHDNNYIVAVTSNNMVSQLEEQTS